MSTAAIRFLTDIPKVHGLQVEGHDRATQAAVVCQGRTLTYRALRQQSEQMTGLLQARGVKPGDRVAWLGRASEAWFVVFFGVVGAGACMVPINTRLAASEVAYILGDCAPDLLLVTKDYENLAREAVSQVARNIAIVSLGEDGGFSSPFRDLLEAASETAPIEALPDNDILQLYTSGTTGKPKGVRLTHANYAAFLQMRQGVDGFNYGQDDTVLIVLPLFHVAAINVSFSGLAGGGRLIVQPEFDAGTMLDTLATENVGHVFLAPVMINTLLQRCEAGQATAFPALRTVSYGASPIAEDVLRRAQAVFGCDFIQFYGMTESAGAGTYLPAADHEGNRLRSCGRPWPQMEARVADPDGREVPAGETGEIQLRGPTLMKGYWSRPDESTATFAAGHWLRTGDVGYMDSQGFCFIQDRLKDMIISGGENVYPAEVENAIHGCPGVRDVAVIGVPDARWGEAVQAVVVAADQRPEPEAIIAWARSRVAGYKAPKHIVFVDQLPRNASGKVLRRELREMFWQDQERRIG